MSHILICAYKKAALPHTILPTGIFMPIEYAAALESALSIISICLPSVFHLFRYAKRHGVSSLFTSTTRSRDLLLVEPIPAVKTMRTTTASCGVQGRLNRSTPADSSSNCYLNTYTFTASQPAMTEGIEMAESAEH